MECHSRSLVPPQIDLILLNAPRHSNSEGARMPENSRLGRTILTCKVSLHDVLGNRETPLMCATRAFRSCCMT